MYSLQFQFCQSCTIFLFPALIDSVKSNLALQLGNRGYLHGSFQNTRLDEIDSLRYQLNIDLNEGEPTYIKRVFVLGLDSASNLKLLPSFGFMEGRIFNKFTMEENISDALTYFEDNGYPFAKIIVSSIYFFHLEMSCQNFSSMILFSQINCRQSEYHINFQNKAYSI